MILLKELPQNSLKNFIKAKHQPEKQFVDAFIQILGNKKYVCLQMGNSHFVIKEFSLFGYGIADLIINKDILRPPKSLDINFLDLLARSPSFARLILTLLSSPYQDFNSICEHIGISPKLTNHYIKFLDYYGLLCNPKKRQIILKKLVPDVKFCAFEAKISDWKSGLKQAYRYRNFAHLSIVLMPTNSIKKITTEKIYFEQMKIGLWTFNEDRGTLEEIFTPSKHPPRNSEAYLRAKALFWAEYSSCK